MAIFGLKLSENCGRTRLLDAYAQTRVTETRRKHAKLELVELAEGEQ
jgi:hypothetical protein